MKANKAPEKIWMSDDTEAIWVTNPHSTRFIEYTRTDAFIEKAWDWIEDNILSSNQQDKSLLYYKQFKKYLEE